MRSAYERPIVSLALSKRKSDKSNLFYTKLKDNIIEMKENSHSPHLLSAQIPAHKTAHMAIYYASAAYDWADWLPIVITVHHRDSLEHTAKSTLLKQKQKQTSEIRFLELWCGQPAKLHILLWKFFRNTKLFVCNDETCFQTCSCALVKILSRKYLTIIVQLIFA